jgi:hypothetical protein
LGRERNHFFRELANGIGEIERGAVLFIGFIGFWPRCSLLDLRNSPFYVVTYYLEIVDLEMTRSAADGMRPLCFWRSSLMRACARLHTLLLSIDKFPSAEGVVAFHARL